MIPVIKRTLYILLFALLLSIILFFSLSNLPFFYIKDYENSGLDTYSISSELGKMQFSSWLDIRERHVQRTLDSLIYVDSSSVGYKDNILNVYVKGKDKGLVIYSPNFCCFYTDGVLQQIDRRDFSGLTQNYIPLEVSDEYLSYILNYEISSNLDGFISLLYELYDFKSLITKAKFDNNEYTGNGVLTLELDSISSSLKIYGLNEAKNVKKSLELIYSQYKEYRWSDYAFRDYELRASSLVRIKR